ncbi:hypothetical protein Tco_1369339, partial [Tanacetum coccineum]
DERVVGIIARAARVGDVRTLIMEEAHATKYSVHPGVNEAVARHGVHVSRIPDKMECILRFWKGMKKSLGTRVDMNTANHP